MTTDQEEFEVFISNYTKTTKGERDIAEEAWYAALAYLRSTLSQQEPVAHLIPESYQDDPIPLYLAPQPAIPDGWKPVPMEPTEEMIDKVIDARMNALCAGKDHNMLDIYRDMLAAAPEPSK